MASAKSDAKLTSAGRKYRIESKSTTADRLAVELAWLSKISQESLSDASTPVVTLSFVRPDGKPRSTCSEWVAMPMWAFKELTE